MKLPEMSRGLLGAHILTNIGEVVETAGMNNKQKIEYVWNRFLDEADGARLARSKRNLFISWLSGLPSALPIEGYNSEIFQVGKDILFLSNSSSDQEVEDFVDSWFSTVTDIFLSLKNE